MLANMMGSPAKSETNNDNALIADGTMVVNYASLMGMGSTMPATTVDKSTGNLSADDQQSANRQNATGLIQLDISNLLQLGKAVAPNAQADASTEGDEQPAAATTDTANILKQQLAALVSKSGQATKEPSATIESSTTADTTQANALHPTLSKDALDNTLNKLLFGNKPQTENALNNLLTPGNGAQSGDGTSIFTKIVAAAANADNDGQLGQSLEQSPGHSRDAQGLSQLDTDSSSLSSVHANTPKSSFHAVTGNESVAKSQRLLQINDTTFSVLRKSDNSLEIRVEPDGIGKLDIGLSVDKGVVHAQISATDPAGKELLEKNLRHILDALAKEGISVGGFSVSLKDRREELSKDGKDTQNGDAAESAAVEAKSSGKPTPVNYYKNNGKINIFA
ncbi:flagellar hook-length control protein FliK [Candidatus Magnetobacterium casense]|uniref:flagellar hook-length control protein FliK n=1 Tax=Candidatus Magnetobacterium casense TaxID=1455061 RepID=UPI0005914DA2|nr:flagellar hook-length control protein FliK [Candidatus Magnetobacterium casensis]